MRELSHCPSQQAYHGKNENAKRAFVLTPLALGILQQQESKLKELGIQSEYLFPDEFGDPIPQGKYYKRWVRYRDANGISKASPYELRHTFVSVIKRLPDGLLRPIIGHSEDMDTYGTYSHEIDGEMEETAQLIQEQFIKILTED